MEEFKVGPLYVTAVRMLRCQGRRDYTRAIMWGTVVLLVSSIVITLTVPIVWLWVALK